MSDAKGLMGWRRAAAAVDGAPLDKVVQLGRPSLENRVGNVKSAQGRLLKAVDEVRAARADLAKTVDPLCAAQARHLQGRDRRCGKLQAALRAMARNQDGRYWSSM